MENLLLIGRLLGLPRRRRPGPGAASCSTAFEPDRRRRPGGQDVLRRHAAPAGPGRQPGRPARRCSSSTSRPPGWTRAAATRCGTWSAAWSPTGVTVLLTTQYLDEADQLADEIAVIDHGRVIATGTPDELKAKTGGADARGPARPTAADLATVARSSARSPAAARGRAGTTVTRPGDRPGGAARRGRAGSTTRASWWPSWPCAAPAWTRSSCPSPATGRADAGRGDLERTPHDRRHRHAPRCPGPRRVEPGRGCAHTADPGLAEPGADQAQPVRAARPEHPADHVRAAVHVRVRRRDLRLARRRTCSSRCPASSCRTRSSPP